MPKHERDEVPGQPAKQMCLDEGDKDKPAHTEAEPQPVIGPGPVPPRAA